MLNQIVDVEVEGTQRINNILGECLGFEDNELAFYIYELAKSSYLPRDLEYHLNSNKLFDFNLPKNLISKLWRVANLQEYSTTNPRSPQNHRKINYNPTSDLKTNL
ncbi:unnamed protein product [Trichobilharzia regenti]|nr:unnamed protein product [Trichobilharzia regenti]